MDLQIRGKVAIVTGGGRGIGKGCVTTLAADGCNLVVADLAHDDITRAAMEELSEKHAVKIICVDGDVSNEECVMRIFEAAYETFGTVDILVNNAGRGAVRKHFYELTTEDWRSVQDIVLNSAFFMSREFARHCREKNKPGSIVNVLSKSAFTTNSIDNTTYISAKAGMNGLTRGMANEMAPYGIRVNAIIPGYVKTEKTYPDGDARTERMRKILPLGEFATPIEIGRVAAFLCSPCASQIVGASIDCSGGTML